MNNMRARVQSRGAPRNAKPQTPDVSKGTKLPSISAAVTSSSDESSPLLWSPNRPPGYAVGVCSQQGKRPYQEDQYAIRQFIHNSSPAGKSAPETHFFGLFDGHAGGKCSQHLSSSLAGTLVEEESFSTNLPLALKRSFITSNEQFLKVAEKNKWHDGSTGNVAVIRDGKLTVANVGDCRALLISNGRPLQMSNDHKPTNPEEQKRIASLGGAVIYCMGVARVNKVLAVSRAFGNRTLRQVIRPDAELMQRELAPGDDFLVMASDGLWDVLRNKDVADVCYSTYLQRKPQAIADELVHMALARGSMDNVTCICVNLSDYRPDDESRIGMDMSGNFNLSRSGNVPNSLDADSLAHNTQGHHFNEEDGLHLTQSGGLQYPVSQSYSQRSSNNFSINNNNQNNNNAPMHEIPSKQKSLGAINPRDLPSVGDGYDPFGLKSSRSSIVKANSTNSMPSENDIMPNFNLPGNASMGSPSPYQSEKNPGNGFLRPLTALEGGLLTSSSNTSLKSPMGRPMPSSNSGANNGNISSNNHNDMAMGVAQQPKLAQIRSMKANGVPSGYDNSGTSGSSLMVSGLSGRIPPSSRPGTMSSMLPRPQQLQQQQSYSSYSNEASQYHHSSGNFSN